MARFHGVIGISEGTVESSPGVWVPNIVERDYVGYIVRSAERANEGEKVNDDLSLETSISIVRDAYIGERFLAIRYVSYAGVLWRVSKVEIQGPRLLLRLGGAYNGNTE